MFYKVVLNKNNRNCQVSGVIAETKERAIEIAKYRLAEVSSENMYDMNEIEEIVKGISTVSCELEFQ